MNDTPCTRTDVLGLPIDQLGWEDALGRIAGWAAAHESRVVCICNVHSVVTARSDAAFRAAVLGCDLATPDGAPVAWWVGRRSGVPQPRLNGPDLMWRYAAQAAARGEGIFLYGSTPATLDALEARLLAAFPGLRIAGRHAPPFRPTTEDEDAAVAREVAASGAGTVWVSLGCPKQELWMARQRGRIPAVMLGVGAAFDYHAGTLRRAPPWMQRAGLEWLHRLASEPRRLWRRYLVTNTRFIAALAWQLLTEWRTPPQRNRN
jgi:N-acetylglucosaminyldiphosphoundecaprenol N-acetyl-beta-D-mannosaminyltransferase